MTVELRDELLLIHKLAGEETAIRLDSLNQEQLLAVKDISIMNLTSEELEEYLPLLAGLCQTKRLKITNCSCKLLPEELPDWFPLLEELDLHFNSLTEIPDFGLCQSLKKVDLSFNRLSGVPGFIRYLANLEILELHYNMEIKFLPEWIKHCGKLQEIDITSTKAADNIPLFFLWLPKIPKLRNLYIGESRALGFLETFPDLKNGMGERIQVG